MRKATTLLCDVQRFSLHDGGGVRTVLFFKGCPLRCIWCQNPEALRRDNELIFSASACIGCGDCVARCEQKALRMGRRGLQIRWSRCDDCLACTAVCPSGALAPVAVSRDVDQIAAEALRDREFYGPSGGVTLSGGEPLVHTAFLGELLPRLKREGLHVAVETSGHWRWDAVAHLWPWIDLVLFDVKADSDAAYRSLTGVGNGTILANLSRLLQADTSVRVRVPVVPPLNIREETLGPLTEQILRAGCNTIEMLPYHRLWESKLAKLRTDARPLGIDPPNAAELQRYAALIRQMGLAVHIEDAVVG